MFLKKRIEIKFGIFYFYIFCHFTFTQKNYLDKDLFIFCKDFKIIITIINSVSIYICIHIRNSYYLFFFRFLHFLATFSFFFSLSPSSHLSRFLFSSLISSLPLLLLTSFDSIFSHLVCLLT